jgi:ornithine decarboxylase
MIHSLTPAQRAFLERRPDTPCLGFDVDVVRDRYRSLAAALPGVELYYAVKASPLPEVVAALAEEGCRFDIASLGELQLCEAQGVEGAAMSFGNTIKKTDAVRHAAKAGVDHFAFDSEEELAKISESAPGSMVMCRLLSEGAGAAWPLSKKFGCSYERVTELLLDAAAAGHRCGVSFHVGSQQLVPEAWDVPLAQVNLIAEALDAAGQTLELVNLGGGFPSRYVEPTPEMDRYGEVILEAVERHVGWLRPRLVAEPGRALVAEAGVLACEVVLASYKEHIDGVRWVYLDVGVFTGLIETLGECIRYPIVTELDGTPAGPCILAGPTCDSLDVLAERSPVDLPLDLREGDRVALLSTGAYVSSYSSVGFNGYAPLRVEIL